MKTRRTKSIKERIIEGYGNINMSIYKWYWINVNKVDSKKVRIP